MDEVLLLQDAPAQRGQQLGQCQKALLKRVVSDFKVLCDKQNLGPVELPGRARELSTAINILAPEWLIESRAIATAAEVGAATLLALTLPPERVQPSFLSKRANDSTALGAAGTALPPEMLGMSKALLLENADGPDLVHFVLSRDASPGSLAYVALAEAGNMGIDAFVNSAGLSGAFHIGPPVQDNGQSALSPSIILRHLCERTSSCGQALSEFESLQNRMGAGTPDKRGVIYIFADGTGEVMLLEASASRCHARRIANGAVILTNRFQHLIQPQSHIEPYRQRCLHEHLQLEPLSLGRALQAARIDKKFGSEKGVCDNNTRASFIAVPGSPDHPGFALVTLGSPLSHLPVPLFPGVGVPLSMLDGTLYTKGKEAAQIPPDKLLDYDGLLLQLLAPVLSGTPNRVQLQGIMNDAWKLSLEISETLALEKAAEARV